MWSLTIVAILSFVASIVFIPWIIIKLPEDYFTHSTRHRCLLEDYPRILQLIFILLKNLIGLGLIIAGIAMLFLPGQGLLTIVVGLLLANFPYKYQLEQWLIRQPKVLQSLNWIREKAEKMPLQT